MDKQALMAQIRLKKLGLLILDARKASRRSLEECARAIGLAPEDLQAIEKGARAISLPELENLAYYLDVPLSHFWGSQSLSAGAKSGDAGQKEQAIKLRNQAIGAILRDAREKSGLSLDQVSQSTSIPVDRLSQFEAGETPAPLPELEQVVATLKLQMEDLVDDRGAVGKLRFEHADIEKFMLLEPDMRQFICAPVNYPYITLARRLSQMSVEKLRSIAESILEITY